MINTRSEALSGLDSIDIIKHCFINPLIQGKSVSVYADHIDKFSKKCMDITIWKKKSRLGDASSIQKYALLY